MEKTIRIMSFNVRNSQDDRNTKYDWVHRKVNVLNIIQLYQPDIIGFQEVFADQLDYLTDNLDEYNYIGVGRDDGVRAGEFTPIFYKNLKIDKFGTFWLSDSPEICSNTWGGLNRICTWVNFNELVPFSCYNTHLDHSKKEIRLKSIPVIINKINLLSKDRPVLLIGDFNFLRFSTEYRLMKRHFRDSYQESQNHDFNWCITYHGFKGRKKSLLSWRGRKIVDYIWLKGSLRAITIEIVYSNPDKVSNIYPSDHWPILADILISNESKN